MNLQSLVVVVLRLMALDFLLQVAVQISPPMLQLLKLYKRSPFDSSPGVLPWFLLGGLILSALLLWALALPIARLVTRRLPQDCSLGAVSLGDCYSIAFVGVGLFYISSHLPQVLNWSHYLLKAAASSGADPWKEQIRGYDVSQAFIPFLVGVLLLVNGRSWAMALARQHQKAESLDRPVEQTDAPPSAPEPE